MSGYSRGKLLICRGRNVVLPDHDQPKPATIVIDTSSGKIVDISQGLETPNRFAVEEDVIEIDAGDKLILPGLVDAHVHLNEPGRTDWEGFWTGTRAAASGGITTVVDMPLNSIPPTTTVENLEIKRKVAKGQCFTDIAFWGGVIPGNQSNLRPLIDAGVKGFKCFLIDSGVEEFPNVAETDLNLAMDELQNTSTALLFHAELDQSNSDISEKQQASQISDPIQYSTFLQSRPEKFERDAISLIIGLQKRYPSLRCHIVHLSASSALPLIQEAKASGLRLTVETCFHYLCLSADDIPSGHPEFKCCPPIRDSPNQDALWSGLQTGLIDCVISDHSPCTIDLKKLDDGDIMGAWGGISTLGLGLSLLWTEGRKRGVPLVQIIDWMSRKPAKHAGLGDRKGQLKVGCDGDFVIWDPDYQFKVSNNALLFKNKLSPYAGWSLYGRTEQTYIRGRLVYDGLRDQAFEDDPIGLML